MNFIDEIVKKEKELLERSSVREKLFYSFLAGKALEQAIAVPDGEIDKVCYAAFTNTQIDISKELQKSLNAAPVRGLHFSNNLISLTAFALKSQDAKNKFLSEFFNSTNFTYQFILHKLFNELPLPGSPKIVTDFDKLTEEVFIKKNYTTVEQLVFTCFEKVNDLIELYVVRSAYQDILGMHPNAEQAALLKELATSSEKFILSAQKRISSYVNISILLVAFALILGIPYFLNKKWNDWNLEPYVTGIQISIGIFWFVILLLFNSNPDWFKVIQNFKDWLLRLSFNKKGIDLNRLKEIVQSNNLTGIQVTRSRKANWKVIITGTIIFISGLVFWYFDMGHRPVEKVYALIGNNYDAAHKLYFRSDPDQDTTFKFKDIQGQLRQGVRNRYYLLKDTLIHEYTWKFSRHNITIWVAKTKTSDHEVIDAIRWKTNAKFK